MKISSINDCLNMDSGYLVTLNLQHLYECRKSKSLRDLLFKNNNVKLCLDGRGAQILFQRAFGKKFSRVVGNEMLDAKLSSLQDAKVLVVGTNAEIIEKIAKKYPNLKFTHDDSLIPQLDSSLAENFASQVYTKYSDEFSLIALALGVPKQEYLASKLVNHYPRTPIVCIGGSFEMLAGIYRRAPKVLQCFGLEGVWRYLLQPNSDRFKRMLKSYFYFTYYLLNKKKLINIFTK